MKNIGFLILLMLTSCAVQVKTHGDPNTDFSKYKTWCWMEGCNINFQGPEYYQEEKVLEEMANAIAWQMHEKGYLQEGDQSDLVLNFYIILSEDSIEIRDYYFSGPEGRFTSNDWLPSYQEYERFLRGSLMIDVIDRRQSRLIWRSTAVRYLELSPTFDKDRIWQGAKKAMRQFPEAVPD